MKKSAKDLNINQLNAFILQSTLWQEVLIKNKVFQPRARILNSLKMQYPVPWK